MIVWVRSLAGIGVLLVSLLVKKNINLSLPSKDLIYLAILGFMGVTFHNLIQAEALKTAQAATSAWIVSTTVIIALLGLDVLKRKDRQNRIDRPFGCIRRVDGTWEGSPLCLRA